MTFLQQSMLWGLFAVSVPIIIHLLNRRRFRTVEWGAMQFLLKATRESRGKKRLKHILILTMRALAIAALIFAVARPLVGGFLGWGGGQVETVVLVLDRSASMERAEEDPQTSKRMSVLERVSDAMTDLGEARLVVVDSATGKAEEVPSPDVLPELSMTAPTDASADIPGMLMTALEYIQEAKPGRSEIWVASDLQRGDWSPEDSRWDAFRANLDELEVNTKLRVLALNARERNDFSIRVQSARREGDELVLDLVLSREEDTGPVSTPVTISHLGARSASEVELNGQSHRFQKRIPLEGREGGGHGYVSIPDNANQRNNVSYYAYGPEAPEYAYLVVEPSTSEEARTALAKGLAPGYANQDVTVRSPDQAHQINYDIASLVVWNAPLPTPPVSAQLLEFVTSGGVVLFLPPTEDSDSSFGGIAWEPVDVAPSDKWFKVNDWNHVEGGFRDSVDGTPLPMERLSAIKRRGLAGDYVTLASWGDGEPLLARRIIDDGKILFLTTSPDYTWSNLELTALHLVLLQRAFDDGSRRLGAGYFALAGSERARPQGEEIRSRIDTYSDRDSFNPAYEAGVYSFGERTVAVNRPAEEDSIEMLSRDQLDSALLDTGYSLLEDQNANNDPFFSEAWRAFLIAMLLFLITEAILCLQPRRARSASTTPTPQPST